MFLVHNLLKGVIRIIGLYIKKIYEALGLEEKEKNVFYGHYKECFISGMAMNVVFTLLAVGIQVYSTKKKEHTYRTKITK